MDKIQVIMFLSIKYVEVSDRSLICFSLSTFIVSARLVPGKCVITELHSQVSLILRWGFMKLPRLVLNSPHSTTRSQSCNPCVSSSQPIELQTCTAWSQSVSVSGVSNYLSHTQLFLWMLSAKAKKTEELYLQCAVW